MRIGVRDGRGPAIVVVPAGSYVAPAHILVQLRLHAGGGRSEEERGEQPAGGRQQARQVI